MEIERKFLKKYLHKIAVDQITHKYKEQGYKISVEEEIGEYTADIIARKKDEVIVIEVKTEKLSSKKMENLAGIADYIRKQKNHKFLIVFATPPREKEIEISPIEILLFKYLTNNFPSELDELSSQTIIENVSNVEVFSVNIDNSSISIEGYGVIDISLNLGSSDNFDNKINESIPFDFDLILSFDNSKNLEIQEISKLEIDTSNYYDIL